MPLRGRQHSSLVTDNQPYFTSLEELDNWANSAQAGSPLTGILPYTPRSILPSGGSGKLLVCHDYKGGYTEIPSSLAYTFNFWSHCDTFIYFAHHRVTIPPSGWVNAAHRQGVKMLGTLIFEHTESEPDCLRLIVGPVPNIITGPAQPSKISWPVSMHYARILADLAYQRGFDGYLLNVEVPLRGGIEQCRALVAWIGMLEEELRKRVGEQSQVIWYDSVVIDGQLRWQDRLNSYNLPFFLTSSAFFTNYTWPPHYPSLTAQYFTSIASDIVHAKNRSKRLNDIFIGVDVWGRGQHGGGGLGCYKALSHIEPKSLGLSVALFGHAWTWESQQDQDGWTWDTWWAYERLLWVGPEDLSDIPIIPDATDAHGMTCTHGPYQPLSSFFDPSPPPNPKHLPFLTTFSPGVGRAWFVKGSKVWEVEDGSQGWTDLDKNTSLGDMVWPRPTLSWHDMESTIPLPTASSTLAMDDAWLGGSSLRLSLEMDKTDAEDAFFRCVWQPIQSLAITPGVVYTLSVVFKTGVGLDQSVELDVGLSLKALRDPSKHDIQVISQSDIVDLECDWQELQVQFTIMGDSDGDISCAAGLILGIIVADPTQSSKAFISLGSLAVYPTTASSYIEPISRILWADFSSSGGPTHFTGALTWETGIHHSPLTQINVTSPEDPNPAWQMSSPTPSFCYFNIYVLAHSMREGEALSPDNASFIGTTGLDGNARRLYVDPACLPTELQNASQVRFYVQGLTSRGTLLPWDECAFVDAERR